MGQFVAKHGIGLRLVQDAQQRQAHKQRAPRERLAAHGQRGFGDEEVGIDARHDVPGWFGLEALCHMANALPQQRCIGL
ncbi:hypothetical protein D3C71_1793380 [compost metagenome]